MGSDLGLVLETKNLGFELGVLKTNKNKSFVFSWS